MSKKLPDGVVDIRGKSYQTVAYRVSAFRQAHPEHSLTTEVIVRDTECVVVCATIADPTGRVIANGHSEEYRKSSQINRTSALENAETSAIGRALAAFGMGGTEFASANEVQNAIQQQADGRRGGHSQSDAVGPPADNYAFPAGPATGITQLKAMARALWREIDGCGDLGELEPLLVTDENKAIIEQCMALENPAHLEIWEGDGKDNPGLNGFIQRRRDELAQIDEFGAVTPALSDADWSKLAQLMEATSSNAAKMLKALSINVTTLDDLDAAQYATVIAALERKLAKMAKKQTTAEYLGDEIKY